ncbi:uncharacterized protein F5891DRAFT_986788 [Suillus fuscotomentosus]|uniref:Protein kinase domain-containing protein n=1 Tax=Suillus fuscotomentosus TaxID=1912939 RepID=A0AAD4HDC9_9AGAM|nr:uncharacterized protein F5891DRAFT_986788 [Suillus fuscotomentosus]KAG1890748.1 hypothetical protein F5891DRAFT_986788 [Suillus fuscotomentosus]
MKIVDAVFDDQGTVATLASRTELMDLDEWKLAQARHSSYFSTYQLFFSHNSSHWHQVLPDTTPSHNVVRPSAGLQSRRFRLASNPSFPQPGQAPEVLQLYLQCLDRLDMLECRVHEEIQEIRSLFRNILDNCQSNVTMEDSGGCDSTVNSQAGLDGLNAITPFGYSHDRYFMPQPTPHASSGVVESLSENIEGSLLLDGTHGFANYVAPQHSMYSEGFPAFCDPRITESSFESEGVKSRLGFSLHGTIDSIYEPAAQPFQSVYLEEHVPSDSLVGPDAQLPISSGVIISEFKFCNGLCPIDPVIKESAAIKPTTGFGKQYRDGRQMNTLSAWIFSLSVLPKKWRKVQPETETSGATHLDVGSNDNERPVGLTVKVAKELAYATVQGSFGDVWKCMVSDKDNNVELDSKPDAIKKQQLSTKPMRVSPKITARNICALKWQSNGNQKEPASVFATYWNGLMDDFCKWKLLCHENILSLYGITYGFGPVPAIVFPWMTNGSLSTYLGRNYDSLSGTHKFGLLAAGLQYRIPRHLCIALSSPRLESDVYSFGCIPYQVSSGKQLYYNIRSDHQVVVAILNGVKPKCPDIPAIEDCHWNFIEQCWVELSQRPPIADVRDLMYHYRDAMC